MLDKVSSILEQNMTLLILTLGLFVSLEVAITKAHDGTQTPGASGFGVVEIVTNRIQVSCIFDDDKLFLRRLAYIESKDGQEATTYRSGYYGGIWQVDQQMYDKTKSPSLKSFIAAVDVTFRLNWMQTTWQDLQKPLVSGLAARLYLQYISLATGIPRSISHQADFWQTNYHPKGDKDDFVHGSIALEKGCQKTTGRDLVFVIGGSSRIGFTNFKNILQFVVDVVSGFDIGPDKTRVAVIQYSNKYNNEFDLNTYNTKEDVINAVKGISYKHGGRKTYDAIDAMVDHSFQEQHGARLLSEGPSRVGIVLTGSKSDYHKTKTAAEKAHAAGITLLAIRVGSKVGVDELDVIASDPDCVHQFYSDSTDIDSLHFAIEKAACDAPIIADATKPETEFGGVVPSGGNQNCKLALPPGGATVKVVTHKGSTTFYVASSTYPSESYYDIKVESVPGRNRVVFLADQETVLCNVQGGSAGQSNYTISIESGDRDWCRSNPCQNEGECADQGTGYICICPPGYTGTYCEELECNPNPCGDHGQWECICEPGFTGKACDESMPPETGYNCDDNNPCTPENIENHHYVHPHEDSSKFIQCSEWGPCYVQNCPPGLVWDPAHTCALP